MSDTPQPHPPQSRSKKNRRALSSIGAVRSTLKSENETQLSGDHGLSDSVSSNMTPVGSFMGVVGSVGGVPAARGKISVIATEDALIENEAIRLESKPWNRLDKGLRIRKIREWVETLTDFTEDLRKDIRICLERSIKSGKLNTNSSVEYDTTTRQIFRVPALRFVKKGARYVGVDGGDDVSDGGECTGEEVVELGEVPRVFVRETDKTKRRKKT